MCPVLPWFISLSTRARLARTSDQPLTSILSIVFDQYMAGIRAMLTSDRPCLVLVFGQCAAVRDGAAHPHYIFEPPDLLIIMINIIIIRRNAIMIMMIIIIIITWQQDAAVGDGAAHLGLRLL
jgi:hypothetical protein